MWPVCSRLLKYWDFEQAQKKPTLRWGGFLYNRFDVKKERRKWGFPQTLIRVRSKLMGYQLALMFNQVEIGYQQLALLRLFKFPHWAIIHLHSDCIARRRVAVWSGGNLCVTKSHLISCRLARPMQIPNTLVYTIVHTQTHTETRTCVCTYTLVFTIEHMETHTERHVHVYAGTHLCSQLYTWKHTQRDTYYVYMHVHTDRRHRRQLKLTSCWPTPRGGSVYVSVWVCSSDFAKYEIRMYFSICVLLHLTCSTTAMLIWTLVQEFCYFPYPPPVKRCSAVSTEACYFVSGTQMILLFNQLSNGECQSIVRCVL